MVPPLKSQLALAVAVLAIGALPASAQERLCDPGNEDCRAILLTYIIDEAIYFTSDTAIVNSFRTRFDDQWAAATMFHFPAADPNRTFLL